ncbi:glucosidase II beta subunit-like-domain-containing protein [Phlyctochytrium arcticum]|nr:glucosidase II beta subunit-like-domain-containing protein [Phlyctochytrium arcticum]
MHLFSSQRAVLGFFVATYSIGLALGDWSPSVALKGVPPNEIARYTAKVGSDSFQCLDKSKTILFSAVNDDYCDCPDGSDEPGTSACSNGSFYCANEGHIGQSIRSSQVNDGVCDDACCDGSDEYSGLITCPNRCHEAGKAHRQQMEEQARTREKGLKLVKEYERFAAEKGIERIGKIKALEEKLQGLKARTKRLSGLKDAAEAYEQGLKDKEAEPNVRPEDVLEILEEEAALKARTTGRCCPTLSRCKSMLEEQFLANGMYFDRIEALQEGAFKLENVPQQVRDADHAIERACGDMEEYNVMYYSDDSQEPDDVMSEDPETEAKASCCERLMFCKASLVNEQERQLYYQDKLDMVKKACEHLDQASRTSKKDEWVEKAVERWVDYKLTYRGEKIPKMGDILELDETKEKHTEDSTPKSPDTKAADSSNEGNCEAEGAISSLTCLKEKIMDSSKNTWDDIKSKLFGRGKTSKGDAESLRINAETARAKLQQAEVEVSEVETELAALRKLDDMDFGPLGVWEKLYKSCAEYDAAEYVYRICILEKAEQKPKSGTAGTGLGTFQRWGPRDETGLKEGDRYKYMLFGDGDRCWNGPARSVEVHLECGSVPEVLSVVEMSKCEYTARMRVPAACAGAGDEATPSTSSIEPKTSDNRHPDEL